MDNSLITTNKKGCHPKYIVAETVTVEPTEVVTVKSTYFYNIPKVNLWDFFLQLYTIFFVLCLENKRFCCIMFM